MKSWHDKQKNWSCFSSSFSRWFTDWSCVSISHVRDRISRYISPWNWLHCSLMMLWVCCRIIFEHLSFNGNSCAIWNALSPTLTLHSSPRAKGKSPSRCSSPQLPPDMELKTMVLTSPPQSKRGLKCMAMFSESWPMLMAKLHRRREQRGEIKTGTHLNCTPPVQSSCAAT